MVDGAQRFFVSYSGVDVGWAEWIAWTLEAEGYEALIQAWDFGAGSHFVGEMHRAVAGGRRTVAVLSDAYLKSAFATEEWQAVWAADPAGANRLLLVVRIEDCDRPGLLRQVVSVDLFGIERDVARQRLLNAIAGRRGKPKCEPVFPVAAASDTITQLPPLNLAARAPAAGSAYLEQVRQIAPPCLVGREAELARLAEFCTAADDATDPAYVWWRAAAWTGKSALMSSFVLDPPAGVRVVSFFITARYAGNSDRLAFVEIVTEQLADILGESVPPFQDPGRRERLWFKFFADAAASCQEQGQRLILAVDGLDEDRGVIGPGARSIAGLLPASPPHGARVVVASRPDPPIPGDVPVGHPLRDPGVIRTLSRSAYAAAIRADMQADLHRLRTGGPLERELLGLVTAAGGGLSGRDLEELSTDTEVTEWDIEQLLSTVAGRSFASRPPNWSSNGAMVYLLGHEELQQDAVRAYGPRNLAAYRDRLHIWAREYRQRQWPQDTPEYLLRGYYRLLLATGDLTRAVECATDQQRHDRMLDLTGGDAAALAEIADAQNTIRAQESSDLPLMARLAVHRQRLAERNSNIPTHLPAVWARLGHATRAEQLACGITDPSSRARALMEVAGSLAQVGEEARAVQVITDAEQVARSIADPSSRARALMELAGSLAQVGEEARAVQVITDAEQVARSIADPSSRARALMELAGSLAQVGEEARAVQVITDAEQVARSIANPEDQVSRLANVAVTFVQAGELARAVQVASDAEQVGRDITNQQDHGWALAYVADALAQAGEYVRAEQLARDITDPHSKAQAQANVADALAQAGELARAAQVAADAEQTVRDVTSIWDHAWELASVAGALAQAGEYVRAEQLARDITSPGNQAGALAKVSGALAQAGEYVRAEQLARDIIEPHSQARALAKVSGALAQAGEYVRAEQLARDIIEPHSQAGALADVAGALARAGERVRAEQVATDAEQVARDIANSRGQVQALVAVAGALARIGERVRAEQVATDAERVARDITNPEQLIQLLTYVVGALARAGERARAEQVATDAEQVARDITNSRGQVQALVAVAGALAQIGEQARAEQVATDAEQVARDITNPVDQGWALVGVAIALAEAGEGVRAEWMARDITDPDAQVWALADVAGALAQAGEYVRAEQLAREIASPHAQARALALAAVAGALAQVGERARALQIITDAEQAARNVASPQPQALALADVANALAQAGEHVRAEQLARDITDPHSRPQALADVANALAQAGEHVRAEQLARDITDPHFQARALADVAGALAQAGNRALATRLLGEALGIGNWTGLPLSVVAEVSPDAIRTIADATVGNREG
ncbi:TIR domain-containing protein [Pseudofrankia sp. BMG5.37]|uniref:TIR domain-containing protein n=1 Tax=Pseudofrankia sp. BMG5.37 TaxID=3050035 RepID=UPI002895AFCD|nr:TIR domain-containing protein [Pseudofrankia sp. BMG5.37]MDT3439119.1 TIR domain-containing protein [Pseudofrankia sp. BMG5.37]